MTEPLTETPPTPGPPLWDSTDLPYSNQLKTIATLLSVILFVVGSFAIWSVYRQYAITNCVNQAAAASSSTSGVGVGDITYCMATH